MAVDTAAKRYSMMGFDAGSGLTLLPAPDGTISSADMQHLLGCYSGIAFGSPSTAPIQSRDRTHPRYAMRDITEPRYTVEDLTGPRYWVRRIQ